jgi:cytochrome P450
MTVSGEALSSVAQAARSAVSSVPPSIPPPGDERSPELVAARALARQRGVVASEGWLRIAAAAIVHLVARILAVPVGAALGAHLGLFAAPLFLFAASPWATRIATLALSPLLGLYLGADLGWRYLVRGKIAAVPLLARTFHKYAPIFTFPKKMTHHTMGIVVVTRHRDVREVLERDDVFRMDGYNERMCATSGAFFLGMDPCPDYEREHALGAASLGRDDALLKEGAGRLAQALVDGALERPSRTLDVVSELAHVVELDLLKNYFGIRDTPDERVLGWLQTMSYFVFNFWIGGPYRAAAIAAGAEMGEHLKKLVRERVADIEAKRPIREDALGRMVIKLYDPTSGKPFDEALAVRTIGGVVSGATVPGIGTFVQAVDRLLDLPSGLRKKLQRAALTGNDAVVRRFVREAARFSAYPPTLYRHAAKPFVFAAGTDREKEAERGAWVVTAPILANYDASVFPDPETFDPDRKESKETGPLLFGWARHRCLGEHMAEVLMVEMAKRLFSRDVERAPGAAGRLTAGTPGTIPDGDFARRLVVRFK